MNKELEYVIKEYCTGSHSKLNQYLLGKSKDTLISIIVDMLTMYVNDKNSSTIREFITVTLAGYEHEQTKIGYNGYKNDTYKPGGKTACEAKPKNIDTSEFERFDKGYRRTKPTLLNGGGNFTDYTTKRLEKDSKANLNMLVSGFIDGRLIYILEFPFNSSDFVSNLKKKLSKFEDKLKGSKSTVGQFLRSADFDYKDYMNADSLRVVYLLSEEELKSYEQYIDKGFYKWLLTKTQKYD